MTALSYDMFTRDLPNVQNIVVNPGLAKAMHAQSGAEREKRARIIESEGERTATQNYSEGWSPHSCFC